MNLPDFDQLLELAKNKPEELETLRAKLVGSLIAKASGDTQARLRGLQFQIDAQRKIHKSPLGACIKISSMMKNSFHDLITQLKQPHSGGNESTTAIIYQLEATDVNQ